MIDLLGWNVGLGAWGIETLLISSVLLGFAASLVGSVRTSYEWLWVAAAALVGGWLGSEWLGRATDWGKVVDGLRLGPWLIGAVGLAIVVDFALRRGTGGTDAHGSRVIG